MPNIINADELYNIEQVLDLLDISRVTFYTWVSLGKLKTITIAEKTFVYKAEVERVKQERNGNGG